MIFVWAFELAFGSPIHLVWIYFILSILGSAHLMNKDRATAIKLRQAYFKDDVKAVEPGQQVPMAESAEFSLPTLEEKARRAENSLKHMTAHEDDTSKHALEAFEYKALAAEKTLKARASQSEQEDSDSTVNFAPPDAPKFSDEQSDTDNDSLAAPSAVPRPASAASATSAAPATSAGLSASAMLAKSDSDSANLVAKNTTEMSDYISNINTGFSMDSEIAKIDSFVNLGASSGSQEVQNLLNQESASNASDLKLAQAGASLSSSTSDEASVVNLLEKEDQSTAQTDAPNLVPEIASQIASSDSLVPDVTTQYNTAPLSLPSPELTLDTVDKGPGVVPNLVSPYNTASSVPAESKSWSMKTNVPEVNSEYKTPNTSVPEVNTQWSNSGSNVPEVNSMLQNSDTGVTEADSQWQNALTSVPEVNSQWQNPNTSVPEVSTQWQNVNSSVPDISAETAKSETNVPDVYSELTKSDQSVPDLNSELAKSDQSVPEVSSQISPASSTFGNFESPKFSFSFDDHISGSGFGSPTAAPTATAEPNCSKCGDAKNPNFSFCLACGQSFS
jgi:hypothetical protein